MKNVKYILLLLGIFIQQYSNAQKKHGEYYINPEIDKFVGTWEYRNGNDLFQIVISKQKIERKTEINGVPIKYYSDMIVGWHSYTKARKVIQNSLGKANTQCKTWSDTYENCTIVSTTAGKKSSGAMLFPDTSKTRLGLGRLELVSGKTNEALDTST